MIFVSKVVKSIIIIHNFKNTLCLIYIVLTIYFFFLHKINNIFNTFALAKKKQIDHNSKNSIVLFCHNICFTRHIK